MDAVLNGKVFGQEQFTIHSRGTAKVSISVTNFTNGEKHLRRKKIQEIKPKKNDEAQME